MSLLIATPMFGRSCHEEHFKSALALKESLVRGDLEHDWLSHENDSLITRCRDAIAATFLGTDFQKLMFIDADIAFSPEAVALLWNMNVPVAVGAYRMKVPDAPLSVWKDGRLVDASGFDGPTAVDYAGTGFMMIDRSVFEALQPHVPAYEEGRVGRCWGFFQDPIEDGIHLSEDYFFCKRFRELGGEIIWHPGVELTHWGQTAF